MNVEQGRDIMQEVRGFFANGHKSCNKMYLNEKGDAVTRNEIKTMKDADAAFEYKQPSMMVRMVTPSSKLAKKQNRAENAKESLLHRPDAKLYSSLYEMGNRLYNAGATDTTSGNCMEMAAISAYLVVHYSHASTNDIYIGSIRHPGDHCFCSVGSAPSGVNVTTLSGTGIIIDPWLNTCCKVGDYYFDSQERLKKWHRDGKRVLWASGPQGYGWYDPGGSYLQGFLSAPVSFEEARAPL